MHFWAVGDGGVVTSDRMVSYAGKDYLVMGSRAGDNVVLEVVPAEGYLHGSAVTAWVVNRLTLQLPLELPLMRGIGVWQNQDEGLIDEVLGVLRSLPDRWLEQLASAP